MCRCKECITYIICRNTLLEQLKYTSPPYERFEVYKAYIVIIEPKCRRFTDKFLRARAIDDRIIAYTFIGNLIGSELLDGIYQ